RNIVTASLTHDSHKHKLKHFLYSGGWKKFEPLWNFLIKTRNLNNMLPLLESILSRVNYGREEKVEMLTEKIPSVIVS
ncbi:MAG: radical SAM protein, partial [Bacteroidetes bacterium]|nr:radical SAM protein [Bacteroidota bacterium]